VLVLVLVASSIAGLLLCWLWLRPRLRKASIGLQEVENDVWLFLSCLAAGSVYCIEERGGQRFVQFVLEDDLSESELVSVRFGMPDAPWSRPYYDSVRARVLEAGFVAADVLTGEAVVRSFIHVVLKGSEKEVAKLMQGLAIIAFGALEVPTESRFISSCEGAWTVAGLRRFEDRMRVNPVSAWITRMIRRLDERSRRDK